MQSDGKFNLFLVHNVTPDNRRVSEIAESLKVNMSKNWQTKHRRQTAEKEKMKRDLQNKANCLKNI